MNDDGPVVIAVDGGMHSDDTLRWGLAHADLHGADVVLVRAWQEPREVAQWAWYPLPEEWRFDLAAAEHLQAEERRAAGSHPHLHVRTRVLHGPAVPALRDAAVGARVLVVGSSSTAGGRRLGRVASHVAAHAPSPVAVVRGAPAGSTTDTRPVAVGVDGSVGSMLAARTAAHEAARRGVSLVVVHARPTVVDPFGTRGAPAPAPDENDEDPTRRAAEILADELRDAHAGLDVHVEVVDDDPAHALVERSRTSGLVVVGCRGLGAFRGMLLGSVSHEVLRGAHSAVLVTRLGDTT